MFRVLTSLVVEHDWRLVALAGIVCFIASLAAITLLHRAQATQGALRTAWLLTAGAATGWGIWSTHFIAMLAYDPGFGVGYDLSLTVSVPCGGRCSNFDRPLGCMSSRSLSAAAGGMIVGRRRCHHALPWHVGVGDARTYHLG